MTDATHQSRIDPARRVEVIGETETHVRYRSAETFVSPRDLFEETFTPIAPPPFLRRATVVEAHAAMVALAENSRAKDDPNYADGVQGCADYLRDLLEGKTP